MYLYVSYPSFIKPWIFSGLPIRWYSLMYLVAFALTYIVFKAYQRKEKPLRSLDEDLTASLFYYAIGFLLLGARVGSCLIYDDFAYYITHPWMMFWPFSEGRFVGLPGMSYHGGVVGCALGVFLFSRKYRQYSFLSLTDGLLCGIPLGFTFGRIGNFLNGELWGRISDKPWAMVFPGAPTFSTTKSWVRDMADRIGMEYVAGDYLNLPRHPSQLYEAFFEGLFLFLIIWLVVRPLVRDRKPGFITGFYLIGYGTVRFMLEYFREPDNQIGFVIQLGERSEPLALFLSPWNFSMGQVLCAIMIIAGLFILLLRSRSAKESSK